MGHDSAQSEAMIHPQPRPIRRRDEAYLKFIRTQPCCVTHVSHQIEANHIREDGKGGLGTKPDDSRALPFADWLHRLYHTIGKKAFEKCYGIDLESEIKRHNALYERVAKPKREYKKPMKAKLSIVNCEACHHAHEIPVSKLIITAGGVVKIRCVNQNQIVEVG